MTWPPEEIKFNKIKKLPQLRRALCDSGLSSGYRGMILIIEQIQEVESAAELMKKIIDDQTGMRQGVLNLK